VDLDDLGIEKVDERKVAKMGVTKAIYEVEVREYEDAPYPVRKETVYLDPRRDSCGDLDLESIVAHKLGVDVDRLGYIKLVREGHA
jgi:hypothetical protein